MASQETSSNGSSHAHRQSSRREDAVRLYKARDYHGAVQLLEQIVKEPPVDYASYYELGRALAKVERPHDALAAFRKALELNPSSAAVLHELGVALRRIGRLSDAAAELTKAIKVRPKQIASYLELARVLERHGKRTDAAGVLRDALPQCQSENDRSEVSRALQALEGDGRRSDRAGVDRAELRGEPEARAAQPISGDPERELRDAVAANPTQVAPRVALGNALRKANRFGEAVEELKRAIALAPDSFEANLELGHALRQLGDNTAARDAFATAVRLKPQRANAHYELGRVLRRLGVVADAERELRRALELNPKLTSATRDLARLLGTLGRDAEAAEVLRGSPGLEADWETQVQYATALLRAGETDEAISALRRAVENAPDEVERVLKLAGFLRQAGRVREAAVALSTASRQTPEVRLECGRALAALGDLDEAAAALAGALQDAEFITTSHGARIELARVRLRQQRFTDAVEALIPAVLHEDCPREVSVLLARAYVGLGKYDAATELLRQMVRKDPSDFDALLELRTVRLAAGDAAGAQKAGHSAAQAAREVLIDAKTAPQVQYAAARVLARTGFEAEAVTVLERVVPKLKLAEGYLELARVQRSRGALLRAHAALKQAVKLAPETATVLEAARVVEGDLHVFRDGWAPSCSVELPLRAEAPIRRPLLVLENSLPQRRSGYALRSQSILSALRGLGLSATAATRPGWGGEAKVDEVDGVRYHRLPLEGDANYNHHPLDSFLQTYADELGLLAKDLEADLIHAVSNFKNGLAGMAVADALGVPFVYELRGLWEETQVANGTIGRASDRYRFFLEQENVCLERADAVVTISEGLRQDVIERGVPADRVFVVPNAVTPERFPLVRRIREQEAGGREGGTTFGYFGALVAYEGIDLLLRAFVRISRSAPDSKLLLAGDGPELEPLQRLAGELGIADRVHFAGSVPHEQILALYGQIDVIVLPRRRHRVCELVSPLKPFEAMSVGRALIVSDVRALAEVVTDGETGLVFPADSEEGLASACLRLASDPRLRRRLARRGAVWVRRHRTWSRVAGAYREVYEAAQHNRRVRLSRLRAPAQRSALQAGPQLRLGPGDHVQLQQEPLRLRVVVTPGGECSLSGKVYAFPGERTHKALVQVEFPGVTLDEASAKDCGLAFSDRVGCYQYLPTSEGVTDWSLKIKVPDAAREMRLSFRSWFAQHPVLLAAKLRCKWVSNEREAEPRTTIKQAYAKGGTAHVSAAAADESVPLFERLRELGLLARSIKSPDKARVLDIAFSLEPTRKRASELLDASVHFGTLELLERPLAYLDGVDEPLSESERKSAATARGYWALDRRLPEVPAAADPIASDGKTVAMVLHNALPQVTNGYATRAHSLLTALSKSDWRVVAITRPGFPTDVAPESAEASSSLVDGIEYRHLAGAHYYDDPLPQYITRAADALEAEFRRIRPSIVHAASAFATALPALIAARRLGLPFIYEVRGLWELTRACTISGWGKTRRFELERALETLVAREADQVLTLTHGLKRELVMRGVRADRIAVAPNAVDLERFAPTPTNAELKASLGFGGSPVIGYVGSLVPYEGLDDLLHAFKILKEKGADFRGLIVGDGTAFAGLQRLAAELAVDDVVTFTGRVPFERAEAYYSLIDIAPFPRKANALTEIVSPLKPFEAMAKGVPVVASSVGALAEIVRHEETGLLFRKGDPAALAASLERLLAEPSLRQSLSTRARQWVESERQWAQTAERLTEAYRRLFDPRVRPGAVRAPQRILVYGDVNLNYIDGSAIWACSLVELLAGIENVEVWLVLKAPIERELVIESIRDLPNVVLVPPDQVKGKARALQQEEAAEVIEALQQQYAFDALVVRGLKACESLANSPACRGVLVPYLVEVFQRPDPWDQPTLSAVKSIARASSVMLCQTEGIRRRLEAQVPEAKGKTALLPPMVPSRVERPASNWDGRRPLRIVYSGKFDPFWGSRELFRTYRALQTVGFPCELHVYGDKIHKPAADPSFHDEILQALESPTVHWHRGVPREEILAALPTYDLGWAWRRPELEGTTDEVSTKVLEYGSSGLAVLFQPNEVNRRLVGDRYPLFLSDIDDAVELFEHLQNGPEALSVAAAAMHDATARFTFDAVRSAHVSAILPSTPPTKSTVLVAGHDLKFIEELIAAFRREGHRVLVDKWSGHASHDEATSRRLLQQSDVVVCEWCLGNAEWYSRNVERQRLIIRFHRQELETAFPSRVNMDRVSKMVFIAPHVQREAEARFGWPAKHPRATFVWNYVDSSVLARPKRPEARFTLGIVGVVPRMKRLDRALDLLAELVANDQRFTLRIKGKRAHEYPWMQHRPEELEYFAEQEERIRTDPALRGRVFFDGFDRDMASWYRNVGYILSVSDFEGSHVSVAEGMASGAIPIIVRWRGAEEMYPAESCFASISEAAVSVQRCVAVDRQELERVRDRCRRYISERCDLTRMVSAWRELIQS